MTINGPARLVRVYIGESDRWHGQPLYAAIVRRAREAGLAGATTLRGIEGYGAHSRLHTTRILRLSEDLPMVVELVDRADRIEAFLPVLGEMVSEGLVVLLDVEVVKYVGGQVPEDD